jgi:predicted ATP-grasp superfamily ATP-dependent carboligase
MKNSTLVIPTMCAGLNAMIAIDLYILNEGMTKLGYIKSQYISPVV